MWLAMLAPQVQNVAIWPERGGKQMTAAKIYAMKFRKARVIKAYAGPERNYTVGETVLWPGDVPVPAWLEVIEILSDEPRGLVSA
jgi:hypothetical protein